MFDHKPVIFHTSTASGQRAGQGALGQSADDKTSSEHKASTLKMRLARPRARKSCGIGEKLWQKCKKYVGFGEFDDNFTQHIFDNGQKQWKMRAFAKNVDD